MKTRNCFMYSRPSVLRKGRLDGRNYMFTVWPFRRPKQPYPLETQAAADSLVAQRKRCIAASFDSLVHAKQRRLNRTDIASSLHVAERCFKNNPGTRQQLVILSDMIQASHVINFNSASLEEPKRSMILRILDKNGRLADLRNVRVSIVGATAPALKRYYDIRDFWLELFAATGATLHPEHYGSALVATVNAY